MPQEVEPNDDFGWADPLIFGVASTGRLSSSWDIDVYGFVAGGSGILTLALDVPTNTALGFFDTAIFAVDGTPLSLISTGADRTWQTAIASAGSYFVAIGSGAFHDGGPYGLTASFAAGSTAGFETEPNGGIGSADTLVLGVPVTGQLSTFVDLDAFRVVASAAGVVTLTLDVPTSSALDYFDAGLYDANGTLLALFSTGTDRTWQAAVATAGSYYVAVDSGSFHVTEPYRLTVGYAAGSTAGFETETNDSFATADTLVPGAAVAGQLSTPEDVDVYRFAVGAAGVVTLALAVPTSSSLPYFEAGVYDASGARLALISTGSDRSWQVAVASAGTYYVAVDAGAFHVTDPYGLAVGFAAGSTAGLETETNDSFATADAVSPGGAISGQIAAYTDIDVFRFDAAASGMLTIGFDAPTDSHYLDYFTVALFDSATNRLATVATGSDRVFQASIAAPGAYYVVVTGGDYVFDTGQYRLELTASAGDGSGFEQEPNDDFANPLPSGSSRLGNVATADDVDWFYIDVAAPSDLAIAFDSPAAGGVLEYFGVWVLDENGNLLASRSTGGDTSFTVGAPAAGSYFIAVTAGLLAHHDGQYALTATATASSVARESETNDGAAAADALALGGSIRGQLSWIGDEDLYVVTLASSGTLMIEFDAPTDSTYANFFVLEVYDAQGVLLAMRDTGGDIAFDAEIAVAGDYLLSVRAAGIFHDDGEYRLSVAAAPDDRVPENAIAGSSGNESISGTGGADLIYGMGGSDRIDGGAGIDTIVFRTGADNLSINGIGGLSAIRGNYAAGEHAFSVSRVWGIEKIQTWSGTENLAVGSVSPMFGTFLSEAISGSSGDDLVDGMGGSDLIDGKAGADTLALFGARDQFTIQTVAGITRIRGGEGTNEYAGHTITAVGIETLAFNQAQTRALETNDVNKIFGSAAADTLVGTAGDDIVDGQGGNDVVDGGAGQDTLVFFGRFAEFAIQFPAAGSDQVVVDGSPGTEHAGRRVVGTNVETLAFLDRNVAVANPPKVVLAPATTFLAEGGAGAVVQISLSVAPNATVAVNLGAGAQLAVSAASLAFGPTNWNVPQSVTVSAVDDSANEQTHGGGLVVSTVAEDGLFANLPSATLAFTISDNDQVATGSVSGSFWNDLNRNRIFDAGETPLANWTVFDDANRNGRRDAGEAEARTDASGAYRIDGLAPGAHTVVAQVETGWVPTFPTAMDSSATIVTNQAMSGALTTAADMAGAQSIGQPTYANLGTATNIAAFRADPRFAGIDGSGYSVVVIDTGIDLDHPFFGADANADGVADRIVFQHDFFGANDASAADGAGHGTHVAGIVASSDPTFPGVAPGANLIVLKVFPDGPGGASFADIIEATNWVVANARQYNVVSVNLSLGSQDFHTAPVNGPLSSQFKALSNSGVVVVSASGNSYAGLQGVSYPSSDPFSLSVGAVWARSGSFGTRQTGTTDAIAFFSQRDDTESDIFAPGVLIDSAFLNGGVGALSGTSMASPQVAGMIALAQQLAERELGRRLSFDEIRGLLRSTGDAIVDGDDENDTVANTGLTFHRIDMLALAEAILGMKQFLPVSHAIEVVAGATLADRNFGFAAAQPTQALSGDDLIIGSPFGEVIRGGGGADRIDAGDGDDSVFGEAGDDFLTGGKGNDLIDGGAGNDAAEYGHAGGPVVAWLNADGSGGATGADGTDMLAGIENLRGGAFADTLTGNAGANTLAGDRGDDRLDGGAGNDLLDGGEGNDIALYPLQRAAYDIELDAAGRVTVRALSGAAGTDTLTSIETLRFSDRDVASTFRLSVVGPAGALPEGDSGGTQFAFVVTRIGDIAGASSAAWTVTGNGINPAQAADFVGGALPSGIVSFAASETQKTIVVQVAGDGAVEADEAFALTLSAPSAGTILATASAIATIANDDSPGAIQLSVAGPSAVVVEGNAGTATILFTLARSGDASGAASVSWSVAGSGANPANAADFAGGSLPSGIVGLAAGETSRTIAVEVAGDIAVEPDEGFVLTLAAPVGAVLATSSVSATIRNDDAQFVLSAPAAAVFEGDAGETQVVFVVAREGDSAGTASVAWSVAGSGGAPANAADFVGAVLPAGIVTFAPGETGRTIAIAVSGDTAIEPDEGFAVALSAPSSGATIATASASTTIRNDDADTRAPLLQAGGASIDVAGTQATLGFDEALAEGVVATTAFVVTSGGQDVPVTAAAVSGRTVVLTLGGAVNADAGATIVYTDAPGDQATGVLQDVAGNDVAGFSAAVTQLGTSISGIAYHWKSRTLLADIAVTAVGDGKAPGGISPLEIRGLAFDAAGDARFEVWANAGAGISAFAIDLRVGGSAPATWTPGAALGGWTASVQAADGRLTVDATGPTAVAGAVALGSVFVDLAPGAAAAQVDVLSASLGGAPTPGFATGLARDVTAADGGYMLLDPADDVTTLSLSRGTGDTGGALTAADALAALKIAVGRNPNADPDGTGPLLPALVSPYQFIAADVNGDGRVTSADALAILKMAVRRADAPAREWIFLREEADFWNESASNVSLDRNSVSFDRPPFATPAGGAQDLDFVGVLKGDVNGSWVPGAGAQTLPQEYFAALSQSLGVPVDIWG